MALLDVQWEDGYIEDDEDLLRQMVRASEEEWSGFARVLDRAFPLCEDGHRRNPRMDRDRNEALVKLAKNKENGGKGGRPPKTQTKPNGFENKTQTKPNGFENGAKTGDFENPNETQTKPKLESESESELELTKQTNQNTQAGADQEVIVLAVKCWEVLQEVPACRRATGDQRAQVRHIAELIALNDWVPRQEWLNVACGARDKFSDMPSMKAKSTFARSAPDVLREYVDKEIRQRFRDIERQKAKTSPPENQPPIRPVGLEVC